MNNKYVVQIIGTRAYLLYNKIKKLVSRVEIIDHLDQLSHKADICIVYGLHYIVKKKYLHIPRLGLWGFHESPLPKGRGCAPLQWTVLHGYNKLTVSFFELIKKIDSGRLLGQEQCVIPKTALLDEIQFLALKLVEKLVDKYLLHFLNGKAIPCEQRGSMSYNRKRTPRDSQLNINKSLKDSWDLIRVCDNELFPAWFKIHQKKFILKRYRFQ